MMAVAPTESMIGSGWAQPGVRTTSRSPPSPVSLGQVELRGAEGNRSGSVGALRQCASQSVAQRGARGDLQLRVDPVEVGAHRARGQVELSADLLVRDCGQFPVLDVTEVTREPSRPRWVGFTLLGVLPLVVL